MQIKKREGDGWLIVQPTTLSCCVWVGDDRAFGRMINSTEEEEGGVPEKKRANQLD